MIDESLYEDREQTQVKHRVLERYLSAFAPIVGSWADDLVYVDCLAGPWKAVGQRKEDTSFARAISALQSAKRDLASRGRYPSVRCLFIEKDPDSYRELEEYCTGIHDIELHAKNWDFAQHVEDVVAFAINRKGSFPFFFIDPKGWELVAIPLIRPILTINPGEVLITLMTSWITRFLSDESKNFKRLLGPAVGHLRQLRGDEQEEELVRVYSEAVRHAGTFEYTCTLPILKSNQDAFHYYMVYATRHPKGVEEFKKTEKFVIPFMHKIRAEAQRRRKLASTGQTTFFKPEETYIERRLTRLNGRYRMQAKEKLEQALRGTSELDYDSAWALAMQFATVEEDDLHEWIEAWRKEGRIETLGLGERQKKPRRGQGHSLRWRL